MQRTRRWVGARWHALASLIGIALLALLFRTGGLRLLTSLPSRRGGPGSDPQRAAGSKESSSQSYSTAAAASHGGLHAVQAATPGRRQASQVSKVTAAAIEPLKAAETLLLYLYAPSDPHYLRNLEFFVEQGVGANDGVDYVIIVQKFEGVAKPLAGLPLLPSNARYVLHANECYDWGTYAWALNGTNGVVDSRKYRHIMFLNSSVRGPFLPAYWPSRIHWTTAFTSRLTADVKLVGSTISSGRIHKHNNPELPFRSNPHVQSYVMATDQEGLRVLRAAGSVFTCHVSMLDTIWHSEIGASAAILEAGYNLDCLLAKYQGVDWRKSTFHGCNGGVNPMWEGRYDGISLNPLEQELCSTTAAMAVTYDKFITRKGEASTVAENAAVDDVEVRLHMEGSPAGGSDSSLTASLLQGCFEINQYREDNADVSEFDDQGVVEHFVSHGRFEKQRQWQIRSNSSCSIRLDLNRVTRQATATIA